jgi:hypothetical protein
VTVFGFPESMREPELIDERAINPERMTVVSFDLPFRNQLPTKLPAAMLQQILKCRTHRALVRHIDGLELTQRLVIILDWLMCWFEVESFHSVAFEDQRDSLRNETTL